MTTEEEKPKQELLKLSDMTDVPAKDRVKYQLRILDGLLAQAIREKDFTGALKIPTLVAPPRRIRAVGLSG